MLTVDDGPVALDGPDRGAARRPLPLRHVVALAAVLVTLWALGPRGHGYTDDGVALEAQVQALAGGSWGVPHPYPAVDPGLARYPDRLASRVEGTDRYVPYAKHPAVPLVLSPVWRLAGSAGVELVVLAGLLAAAVAVSRVVRRVAPDAAVAALWLVGAGSALVVHGFVLWLHAWALALAAVAVGAALALLEPGRLPSPWRSWLVLAAALVAAILVRTEGALLAVAVAAALAWTGGRRRRPDLVAGAAVVAVLAAATVVVEGLWIRSLVGGTLVPPPPQPSGGWLADRVTGSVFVFLLGGLTPGVALVRLGLVAALGGAVAGIRSGVAGRRAVVPMVAVTAAYGVAVAVVGPRPVPGLLPALPLLVVPLLLPAPRPGWHRQPLIVMAGAYLALVAVTVYPGGGGADWGGRYAALAVPVLAPLAAERLTSGRRGAGPGLVAVCLVATSLAAAPPAYLELRAAARSAAQVRRTVLAEAARHQPAPVTGRPVVLVLDPHLARLLSLEQGALTPLRPDGPDGLTDVLGRLADDGTRQVLVVARPPLATARAAAEAAGWRAGPGRALSPNLEALTLDAG